MSESKPSYRLVPIVQTPNVDPGETIKVSLYCVGHGQVEKANLSVNLDHPNLLNSKNPGQYIMSTGILTDMKSGISLPVPGFIQVNEPEELTLTSIDAFPLLTDYEFLRNISDFVDSITPGSAIAEGVPDTMYSNILFSNNFKPIPSNDLPNEDDRGKLRDFSEGESRPPLAIELETLPPKPILRQWESGDFCRPGNYDIAITLTYGDDERVYQDQKTVTIHANNLIERRSTELRIAALILATLAGLAALPTLVTNLIELAQQFSNLFNSLIEFY